jgi:hypothetical protein
MTISKDFVCFQAFFKFTYREIDVTKNDEHFQKDEFKRRLLNLTNDNASNNYKMRRFVRKILLKNDIEWNHEKNHVSCLTHIIQLTMNELLKSLKIFVINDIVNFEFKKTFVIHITNDLSFSTTLLKMCIFHQFFSQNKCLN